MSPRPTSALECMMVGQCNMSDDDSQPIIFKAQLCQPDVHHHYGYVYKTLDGKEVLCYTMMWKFMIKKIQDDDPRYVNVLYPRIKAVTGYKAVKAWFKSQGVVMTA